MSDTVVESKSSKKKGVIIGIIAGVVAIIACIVALIIFTSGASGRNYKKQVDLGNKYLSELDYDQAIAAFEEAIRINPKGGEAYIGLMKSYIALGDEENIRNVLQRGEANLEDEFLTELRKLAEIALAELESRKQTGEEKNTEEVVPEEEQDSADVTAAKSELDELFDSDDYKGILDFFKEEGFLDKLSNNVVCSQPFTVYNWSTYEENVVKEDFEVHYFIGDDPDNVAKGDIIIVGEFYPEPGYTDYYMPMFGGEGDGSGEVYEYTVEYKADDYIYVIQRGEGSSFEFGRDTGFVTSSQGDKMITINLTKGEIEDYWDTKTIYYFSENEVVDSYTYDDVDKDELEFILHT